MDKGHCSCCGVSIVKHSYSGQCQTCYRYFKTGNIIHPIPKKGEMGYDEEGRVICHICGKSFTSLGYHIYNFHGMSSDEYRELFGLCRNTQLSSKEFHDKKAKFNYEYGWDKILPELGINTRISKSNNIRANKKSRHQEVQERLNRLKQYYAVKNTDKN